MAAGVGRGAGSEVAGRNDPGPLWCPAAHAARACPGDHVLGDLEGIEVGVAVGVERAAEQRPAVVRKGRRRPAVVAAAEDEDAELAGRQAHQRLHVGEPGEPRRQDEAVRSEDQEGPVASAAQPWVVGDRVEVGAVAGVGELVKIDHRLIGRGQPVVNKIAAYEASATCYEDSHASTPFGQYSRLNQ